MSSLTSTTSLTRRNSARRNRRVRARDPRSGSGRRDHGVVQSARPQFFLIPNLPDTPPFGNDLVWLSETLPAAGRSAETSRGDDAFETAAVRCSGAQSEEAHRGWCPHRVRDRRRIGAPYGWSAHAEIADMVAAGMTPAQVIVAATRVGGGLAPRCARIARARQERRLHRPQRQPSREHREHATHLAGTCAGGRSIERH